MPNTLQEAFESYRVDAVRLEGLPIYNVPEESSAFASFKDGEVADMTFLREWIRHLELASASGRRHRRVRILASPPSLYQRFQLECGYPLTIAAGEDIRFLPDTAGGWSPRSDAWIFDHKYVFNMAYDSDGRFLSATPVDEREAAITAALVEDLWTDGSADH